MSEWTPDEERWVHRAKHLFSEKPRNVLLYTTDGEIVACKLGVPSDDICAIVGKAHTINCGAMLTDMHDDFDCGRD